MFKLDLEKAEEPDIRLPTSVGSSKTQKSFRKTSTSAFIDYAKAFDCVNHNKLENSERDGNTSWEICMQVKKQQLELGMEQQTGSKSGKENIKAVYCHPAYLTSMQSTLWEVPG